MKLIELLTGIVPITLDVNPEVLAITNDSRQVTKGSLFIAYQGEVADGRDYIADAIEKGAVTILYQANDADRMVFPITNVPLIPVLNLQDLQGKIASRFFGEPSANMTMIGVTGTNGKTSCTHFIAQLLMQQQCPCAVMGTLGYGFLAHLTPSTHTTLDAITLQKELAQIYSQDAQAVALEVSSHSLVQKRVAGVHFDIAVYTQLSRDHLDYHATMEDYAAAKALLFTQPGLRTAIINWDDPWGQKFVRQFAHSLSVITYSANGDQPIGLPAVVAKEVKPTPQGFVVVVETPWGRGNFTTSLLGQFNVSNLLAVLAVLGVMNIPFERILLGLQSLKNVAGRMQVLGGGQKPTVVIDYAHTPDALQKVLIALNHHKYGQLWCVFGCGGDRDRGKRPLMAQIAVQHSDKIIITNDNPRTESPEQIVNEICAGVDSSLIHHIELDRAKAINLAIESAQVGDIVLIAGKGHEDYQIIGHEKIPFSDSETVRQALK